MSNHNRAVNNTPIAISLPRVGEISQRHQVAEEVAQWLRGLAALANELCSICSTHVVAQQFATPIPEYLMPLWAPGTHMAHGHTCKQNTYTHKIYRPF